MVMKRGDVLADKYEVLKIIDTGGMSRVYIVMDLTLNKYWAIKEIVIDGSKKSTIEFKSLMTETKIMKGLDHPYLPRVVETMEDPKNLYLVMDYVDGHTLTDVIKSEGSLPQNKVLKWMKQLAVACKYLHDSNPQIIYRDMKTDNVMLQTNGDIKLLDFGASRYLVNKESWRTTPLGTRGYAAPERYGSKAKFDVRSDMYELGMTFYHMLTGFDPSKDPDGVLSMTELRPEINGGLVEIVNKMTKFKPEDRYQSMDDLLYDLENYKELDKDYIASVSKKLKTMAVVGLASVVMFGLGGVSALADSAIKSKSFEEKIEEARYLGDTALAIEASQVIRGSVEPYDVMLGIYTRDGELTDVEDVELRSAIASNSSELSKSSNYGQLAYDLVETYLYYGSNLSNQVEQLNRWIGVSLENNSDDLNLKVRTIKDFMEYKDPYESDTAYMGYMNALMVLMTDSTEDSFKQLKNTEWMLEHIENINDSVLENKEDMETVRSTINYLQTYLTTIEPKTELEDEKYKDLSSQLESISSKYLKDK